MLDDVVRSYGCKAKRWRGGPSLVASAGERLAVVAARAGQISNSAPDAGVELTSTVLVCPCGAIEWDMAIAREVKMNEATDDELRGMSIVRCILPY